MFNPSEWVELAHKEQIKGKGHLWSFEYIQKYVKTTRDAKG